MNQSRSPTHSTYVLFGVPPWLHGSQASWGLVWPDQVTQTATDKGVGQRLTQWVDTPNLLYQRRVTTRSAGCWAVIFQPRCDLISSIHTARADQLRHIVFKPRALMSFPNACSPGRLPGVNSIGDQNCNWRRENWRQNPPPRIHPGDAEHLAKAEEIDADCLLHYPSRFLDVPPEPTAEVACIKVDAWKRAWTKTPT